MRLKRKHLDELSLLVRLLGRSIAAVDDPDTSEEAEAAETQRDVHFDDLKAWIDEMRWKITKSETAATARETQSSKATA